MSPHVGHSDEARRSSLLEGAQTIASEFVFDADSVSKATYYISERMKEGLSKGNANQIPSYVTSIPDGSETGVYLAVDLGGTNCRVCSVELHGNATYTLRKSNHVVPWELRVNKSYRPLFLFIAQNLRGFLDEHHPEKDYKTAPHRDSFVAEASPNNRRQLGFTFSFTCDQTSLATGTLVHWDKGWDIPNALGRDPCAMLQWAIDELHLPVVVSALANDSIGTLLARSYTAGTGTSTLAAAIFGTGTNAAYVEQLANVVKLRTRPDFRSAAAEDVTVINTEWGSFDEELRVLPTTPCDGQLDQESLQPGEQMMEKRVGALYLGELLRLAVVRLMGTCQFDMVVPEGSLLDVQHGLNASLLSYLAVDSSDALNGAREAISTALAASQVSINDAKAMQLIAMAITRRAARIAGASIAAIVVRSGRLYSESQPAPKGTNYPVDHRWTDDQKASERPSDGHRGFISSLSRILQRVFRLFGSRWLSRPRPSSGKTSISSSLSEPIAAPARKSTLDIGVDGSLIEFYPGFEEEIRGALRDVPEIGREGEASISIGMARNGSSVGAALMALAASRQKSDIA